MRRLLAFALASVALAAPGAQAPTPSPAPAEAKPVAGSLESIPPALLDQALSVSVHASVARPAGEVAWEADEVKYTIPGTSVSVRMVGSDVAVIITLTPYRSNDGGLVLIAQGQVWYKDGTAGVSYRTTLDTINVAFGEPILFYPLGVDAEGAAPLSIAIVVDRYTPAQPEPPAPTAAEAPTAAPSP